MSLTANPKGSCKRNDARLLASTIVGGRNRAAGGRVDRRVTWHRLRTPGIPCAAQQHAAQHPAQQQPQHRSSSSRRGAPYQILRRSVERGRLLFLAASGGFLLNDHRPGVSAAAPSVLVGARLATPEEDVLTRGPPQRRLATPGRTPSLSRNWCVRVKFGGFNCAMSVVSSRGCTLAMCSKRLQRCGIGVAARTRTSRSGVLRVAADPVPDPLTMISC
eukprot:363521-Chlamydomonas_euryale.AAC.8